jgi:hypothetical protein
MLAYEMWMMQRSQEQLAAWDALDYKRANGGRDAHVYFAVLESFLLHARNLFAFYLDSPQGDDVTARAVLPQGARWQPVRVPAVKEWRTQISKTVQHLTASRDVPHIEWDEPAIRRYLDGLFAQLNSHGPVGGAVDVAHPERQP